VLWLGLAAINLCAGAVVSLMPQRQYDLQTMRRWGGEWLAGGTDIYRLPDEAPDYPPNAIVLLAPLSRLPDDAAPVMWAALNLTLAPVVARLAVRSMPGARANGDALLLASMLLCWGGFRTLQQFTLVTLAFGLAAMSLARRAPVRAGVLLGLALAKPHIAVPFVLWALFERRWRMLTAALAVTVAGFSLYCVVADSSPASVVRGYVGVLGLVYGGDSLGLVGLANLKPLFEQLTAEFTISAALAGAAAAVLLILVCVAGFAEGSRHRPVVLAAPALAGIWSLLTFYHLTYNFLLLLPAAVALWCLDHPETERTRTRTFWLLQGALMFDVPGLWRRFGTGLGLPETIGTLAPHFDRVLMIGLFVVIGALAVRTMAASGAPPRRSLRSVVDGDRPGDCEQDRVRRQQQAGVPRALHRDCRQGGDSAGADPEHRGAIGADRA
jgi:hypothetical protein